MLRIDSQQAIPTMACATSVSIPISIRIDVVTLYVVTCDAAPAVSVVIVRQLCKDYKLCYV